MGMAGRTAREGFRGSLAWEWVCLTLPQNAAGAAAATHLPPLPSPPRALQRTAAESRPFAESPSEGWLTRVAEAGSRGCRSSLEDRGWEMRGGWSRGAATKRSWIGESHNGDCRGWSDFPAQSSPLSPGSAPAAGYTGVVQRGEGAGSLCNLYTLVPGCPPRSSLQVGSADCLHIISLPRFYPAFPHLSLFQPRYWEASFV